jgi:RNA polymerase sigma factor (sigma-70 family)
MCSSTCGGRLTGSEGRSSVSTWLISIARLKALSARRRQTDAELDEKIETTVADTANDPEAVLQENNGGELLRQALTRLFLEHREIIDFVYYHEKSVEESATILGIPAATAKTRMFYARRTLGSSHGRRPFRDQPPACHRVRRPPAGTACARPEHRDAAAVGDLSYGRGWSRMDWRPHAATARSGSRDPSGIDHGATMKSNRRRTSSG